MNIKLSPLINDPKHILNHSLLEAHIMLNNSMSIINRDNKGT